MKSQLKETLWNNGKRIQSALLATLLALHPLAVPAAAADSENIVSETRETEATSSAAEKKDDRFSVYAVVYKTSFSFGDYQYSLTWNGRTMLSEVLAGLHITSPETGEELTVWDIKDVQFSDESLLSVAKISEETTLANVKEEQGLSVLEGDAEAILTGPDWILLSRRAFHDQETLTITANDNSIYEIAMTDATEHSWEISDAGETYRITLSYDDSVELPGDAELRVHEITEEDEDYAHYLEQAMEVTEGKSQAARFFDIEIWADGEIIEPSGNVQVEIALVETTEQAGADKQIVHFAEDGVEIIEPQKVEPQMAESLQEVEGEEEAIEEAEEEAEEPSRIIFDADSFSVYGVVYTVDFHWEVNGRIYDFSMPGGGFVSFSQLVEVLGIAGRDDADATGENAAVTAYFENDGEVFSLADISISERTRRFVEDMESVEFSAPELMWVGKVESDTQVGTLKAKHNLNIQYSAELTEEQIAHINASEVSGGDWVMISLMAFDTEEFLAVTMKNGDHLVIRVTDARDPYNISGQSFSIVNQKGGSGGAWSALKNGTNAMGTNDRGAYLAATSSTAVTTANGREYCQIGSQVWTFEFIETDENGNNYYRISNNDQYLSINPELSSKEDTPNSTPKKNTDALKLTSNADDPGTRLKVTKNSDGTFIISNDNDLALWNYSGKFWLSNPTTDEGGNDTDARMHLALPENPAGEHMADMISAASLVDGQQIVVYQRIYQGDKAGFNPERDPLYRYYAIDGNGKPVEVYQNGEAIYWKGNASVEWTLTELYNDDGSTTGYYTLYNETTGTYLTPKKDTGADKSTAVHKLSDYADGDSKHLSISLPGKTNEKYISAISCWDYDANVTYGLGVQDGSPITVTTPALMESQPFYFASREPVVQKDLTRVQTVDSNLLGIKITMYDFNGEAEDSNPTSNYEYYIPARLKFMDEIMGNEYWHQGVYDAGFVSRYLEDNGEYPKIVKNDSGKRLWSDGTVVGKSLRELFENTGTYGGNPQVTKTENVNNLFIQSVYDATGYFHYSCFENAAYLNGSDFEVYDQLASGTDSNNYAKRGNFWPYDRPDTSVTPKKNEYDTNLDSFVSGRNQGFPRENEDVYLVNNGNAPNYYFGMIMETKFSQNQDGYADNGDPMIFEFNGDDDMWVYIDNVLVLDIGGVHDAFRGRINFHTGEVKVIGPETSGTVAGETTYIKEQFWQAHRFPDGSEWKDINDPTQDKFFTNDGRTNDGKLKGTFKDFSTHDFKMFYMERGAGASQLEMTFNLPVLTGSQFRIQKEMPETSTGGIIQNDYADAAFYYKAYVKDGDAYTAVSRKYLTDRGLGLPVYNDETHTPVVWKSDDPNETIFEVKPGDTAVFPAVDDSVSWYVVEVEPESGSHMLAHYTISNSDPNPYYTDSDMVMNDGAATLEKTVKERNIVTYENRPDDSIVNELQIKKEIVGSAYHDNDAFEYRIFLENTDGELVAYSLGEYYQIDKDGRYIYYKDGQRTLQSENPDGPYTYDGIISEVPRYAEHTSVNGSVGDIRDGDTLIIKGLLEGTEFYVYERTDYDYMTKDGAHEEGKYTFIGTEVRDAYTRIPEQNEPNYLTGTLYDMPGTSGIDKYHPSDYEREHAANGTIIQEKDAKVLVRNNAGLAYELELKKNWPNDSDLFTMDQLPENTTVVFKLGRYKLETRHGSVILNGSYTVKTDDPVPEGIDPHYVFVKDGKTVKTVRYQDLASGSIRITDLPVGTYTVYCYDNIPDYDMSYTPVQVTVTEDDGSAQSASVSVASTYSRQRSDLVISKDLSGAYNIGHSDSFTYTVKEGDTVIREVSITGSDFTDGYAYVRISDLPTGTYTVTETVHVANDKGEHAPASQTMRVSTRTEAWAAFTGRYEPESKKIPVRIHSGYNGNQNSFGTEVSANGKIYSDTYCAGDTIRIKADVKQTSYYDGVYYYGTSMNNLNNYVQAYVNNTGGTLTTKSFDITIPADADSLDIYITSQCATSDWAPIINGDPEVIASASGAQATSKTGLKSVRRAAPKRAAAGVVTEDVDPVTQAIVPASHLPVLTPEEAALYSYVADDEWELTVEVTKNGYTLKDGSKIIGTGTITIGDMSGESASNFWDAVISNNAILSRDENGDLYYYYISSVSEKNVPEGMNPSFDLKDGKPLIAYDKEGGDNVLSVTNEILQASAEIRIRKVVRGTSKPLPGVSFKLTKVDASGHEIKDEKEKYTSGNVTVDPDTGVILFAGLQPGCRYVLEEVNVPEGYVKSEGPYYLSIAADGTLSIDTTLTGTHNLIMLEEDGLGFKIENEPGTALPNTGGSGTRIFTILGSILILGAGVLLWRRRRFV